MKLDFLQQNSTTSQLCFIEKMKSVKGSIQQMLSYTNYDDAVTKSGVLERFAF